MQLTKDPQGILEMLRLCDQVRLGPRVQGLRSRLCGQVRLGFGARLNKIHDFVKKYSVCKSEKRLCGCYLLTGLELT